MKNSKNEVKKNVEVKKDEAKKVTNNFLHSIISKGNNSLSCNRTLKNTNKFSNDDVILRAYKVVEGVIKDNKLTCDNVFNFCVEGYKKAPLDCNKKDIKRPQRYLASLCCKATNNARSTSSFQQDIAHIGNRSNRIIMLELSKKYPEIKEDTLNIIFKGTFLPSRTK